MAEKLSLTEEEEKFLQSLEKNTQQDSVVEQPSIPEQEAEERFYGVPTKSTPSFYEYHGINDPVTAGKEEAVTKNVAYWINKALEDQENELEIPENSFIQEQVVPMTYRIGAPVAYPAVVAGATGAAKWARRLKWIKQGRVLTRNVAKAPTPLTIGTFIVGEALAGIAGEYAAQKHLIANQYQDEIDPGHLISAGVINSFTIGGLTKVGKTLPEWLKAFPEGTKMSKWAKTLNTTKVYGGYAIRGGTVGSVSSAIDQSYDILSDEEKTFLEDWNWEYFGKAALAGAGVDASLNLGGRAAKRAANSKILRDSKTFKKGVSLHTKVIEAARNRELKAIQKGLETLEAKKVDLEKSMGVANKPGFEADFNLLRREWDKITGQRNKLRDHLEDARSVYNQTASRLQEMEELALKKLNEETYASFVGRQKRIPQFFDNKGLPVKPNVQGELILYRVEGHLAKLGQVTLSTKRPKQGKAVSVRIPQTKVKLLDQLDDGAVIFTAQQKQFEAAVNKTPALLKAVLEADKGAAKVKLTPEEKSNIQRLLESPTSTPADNLINPAQHAKDVETLKAMTRSNLGKAGDVAVKQAEVYQRFLPYAKHLMEKLPEIKTNTQAVDDVLVLIDRTMEIDAAAAGLDFKTATSMLAMKEMTPKDLQDFSTIYGGRTISQASLRRQAALLELKEAVEAFKTTKDLSALNEAAEEVAGTSRQIQRQNRARAKQNKKDRENKYRNVLSKVMKLHNGAQGATKLSPFDAVIDGALTARTAALLMAPDTFLLGPATYIFNGLAVQPAKQTGKNVVKAFGWGGALKDANLADRISYALTDTPVNLSKNNFYLQNILALASKPGWSNFVSTFKMGGRSTLFPKASGYIDSSNPSKALSMLDLIKGQRETRLQESPGVSGLLFKRAPGTIADAINFGFKLTGTAMGAADEPLFYALHRANLATEGQRQAIELGIPKTQRSKFVEDFVTRQFLKEGNLTTINEAAEAIGSANQTLRAMGRGPKYGVEGVDFRKTMWERFADKGGEMMSLDKGLTQAATMRVLFPVFGIPVRLSGQSMDFLFSPLTTTGVGVRATVEATGKERLGPYRGTLNKLDASIREGEEALKVFRKTGTPEQINQTEKALSSDRRKLNQTISLRNEEVAANAGAATLALGVFALGLKLAENGELTGTGSFLTPAQKKTMDFKSFRFGGESFEIEGVEVATGEGGSDLRYSDRIKMAMAFAGDLKLWTEMKNAGLLTKDNPQTFDEFVAGWVTPALQEQNVANTLNSIADIAVGSPGEREAATRRLTASFSMVPSVFRKYQQVNQELFQEDITQGPMLSSSFKYGAGLETGNFKRDMFLRKVEKETITPLGFWIRSAFKQSTGTDALDAIVRRDSLLKDGGSLSRQGTKQTIKQAKLVDFVKEGEEETLFQVYADLVNTVEHPKYGGKTQEEVLFDLIDSSAWQKKYNDGYYTKREEGEDGLPFNEGINELNQVRRSFLNLAQEKLLDEEKLLGGSYRNKKQENIYQFLYNLREE